MDATEVAVHEGIARLRLVARFFGQTEVPFRVLLPGVGTQVGGLVLRSWCTSLQSLSRTDCRAAMSRRARASARVLTAYEAMAMSRPPLEETVGEHHDIVISCHRPDELEAPRRQAVTE